MGERVVKIKQQTRRMPSTTANQMEAPVTTNQTQDWQQREGGSVRRSGQCTMHNNEVNVGTQTQEVRNLINEDRERQLEHSTAQHNSTTVGKWIVSNR